MRPVPILYVIDALGRGGTELQLVGLIERLDRAAFQPHLCTLRPGHALAPEVACPQLALRIGSLAAPRSWLELRRLVGYLRRERVALVQTFFQDATLIGGLAGWLARVPVRVGSFRDLGFWRTGKQEFLLRRVFPLLNGFVANSEAVKDHYCRSDRIRPDRIAVIHNGIDVGVEPPAERGESAPVIGLVGNLNRKVKRADLFLKAATLVARRHPQVRWRIVGDGCLRPELEQLAVRLGVAECVTFAGAVQNVAAHLRHWDVGVICSDSEGFANAVLEYMLHGCAVVATDVGGNREAIVSGRTGLLVPPDDAPALADALARLIESPQLRRQLTGRARAAVERDFGWDRCVDAHQLLYRRYLERSTHDRGRPGRQRSPDGDR